MAVAQVGWQIADGIRSLRSMLAMLEQAAAGCRLSPKRVARWDSIGFRFDRRYWIGVAYDAPNQVRFQTEAVRIDPSAARALGVGTVFEKSWAPGGLIWRHVAELDSEEIRFFARTKVGQMQWLEKFVRECLEKAHSIETPDQPLIPEDLEGD